MTQETPGLAEDDGRRRFIARHWRGELSLARSGWVDGVLIGLVFLALSAGVGVLCAVYLKDYVALAACLGATALAQLMLLIWQVVGIWRSADRHVSHGGRTGQAILARVGIPIGVFVAAALTWVNCMIVPTTMFLNRGAAEDGRGAYDDAIADDDRAVWLSPWYDLAYYDRGVVYTHKRD